MLFCKRVIHHRKFLYQFTLDLDLYDGKALELLDDLFLAKNGPVHGGAVLAPRPTLVLDSLH